MKLIISKTIKNKIKYFLSRFPSKEWSGPAWYRVTTDDDGFPKTFTLCHFHPLDLGHGTSTDWEAKDFAKILRQSYESHPKLKKCVVGLIHSHHTMGAFFSGTDESTLEDMAPKENFYCSLVVASQKDEYAFAFSYLDQYGKGNLYKIDKDDIVVSDGFKPVQEWVDIADGIEKEATTHTSVWTGHMGVNGWGKPIANYNGTKQTVSNGVDPNQGKLPLVTASSVGSPYYDPYEEYGVPLGGTTIDECIDAQYGYHGIPTEIESLSIANIEEIEAIGAEFEGNTINWYTFKEEMNKMGLEPWHYFNLKDIPIKDEKAKK